ncbi:VOC family protein [Hoyosella rhizosphaerae]|uniref:Hydrolase n=1 Tax=Hoyosella rhizosphaerae TaxID=1755582 RepID=A0A916UCN8_9ACTN|nr:VOC family protein [Hoyosella rhizosphaerae]MBN4925825.1 VOC family protein [Hoyosella rhizosphaerae]GGC67653.1 hydrolase [Hoyosella rhizosphaerae]
MTIRTNVWPVGTPCWADCQVDDVATARDFYTAVLGWEYQDTDPEAGGYLVATKDGHPVAGVGPKPPGMEQMPSSWTTYLASDDVDSTVQTANAAGGQILMPPMDVMSAGRMAIITDPTGAAVGLWEGRDHPGAELVNEPGAMCWNELYTSDLERARAFFTTVFDYSYDDISNDEMQYNIAKVGGHEVAGMMVNAETPPMWNVYFTVEDCDKATDTVSQRGGQVFMPPMDTPYGRMSFVQSPQGEVLGLVDVATTVGEMPQPN